MARKSTPARAEHGTVTPAIVKVFQRKNGATAAELGDVTGWKHNPARYYANKYCPEGYVVVEAPRADGAVAYRMVKADKVTKAMTKAPVLTRAKKTRKSARKVTSGVAKLAA